LKSEHGEVTLLLTNTEDLEMVAVELRVEWRHDCMLPDDLSARTRGFPSFGSLRVSGYRTARGSLPRLKRGLRAFLLAHRPFVRTGSSG
jgi:hypothetical protein